MEINLRLSSILCFIFFIIRTSLPVSVQTLLGFTSFGTKCALIGHHAREVLGLNMVPHIGGGLVAVLVTNPTITLRTVTALHYVFLQLRQGIYKCYLD